MKRFYNNTLISGAFSKALRVLALLCVLLGFSANAWGDELNSSYKGKSIYVAGSFNNWSTNAWKLSTTDNNYYSGEFTIAGQSDNYTFKIYSEGKYFAVDGYWFTLSNTTATKLVTDNNNMQIDCISNSGNISVKFELYCEYDGTSRLTVTQTTIVADPEYALGGWINKTDKKSYSNGIKLTKQNDGTYTTTTSFTVNADQFNGKYGQWVQIYGNDSKKYGFSTKEQSVALNTEATLVEVSGDDGFFIETTIGTNYTFTWNPTTKKFKYTGDSGSDDDDDDPVGDCGETIEILCKGVDSYIDMWCYAWNPDNKDEQPLKPWLGSPRQGTVMYDGAEYAKWTVEGYDKLSIIFNNGKNEQTCQTNDIVGLVKGKRYIIDLPSTWCSQNITYRSVDCSGGEEEVVDNGTVFLNIASVGDWDDAGAILKVNITEKSGTSKEYDLVQCETEPTIYYVNEVLNLNNISKVNMLRYNDQGTAVWNRTGDITFNKATPCVKLTSWGSDGYVNYTLTTYTGSCGVTSSSPVILTYDAVVASDGKTVTMYAYLEETFCSNIAEYGFLYCPGTATTGCTPSKSSNKLTVDGGQLYRGQSYSLQTSSLPVNTTYGYKAYIKVGDMIYISTETGYFTLGDCTNRPKQGSPITYTVDASLGEKYEDPCTLTYGSLQTAIQKLKESNTEGEPYQYVTKSGSSYNLNQPVTINVVYYDDTPDDDTQAYIYRGTTSVGKYAGDKTPKNSNLLEDINRSGANASHTLTIKAGTSKAKPWIHHIVIRNSKNIVLDSLCIYSDPNNVGDNAIEMDKNIASGSDSWNTLNSNGYVENANILVQNCMIGSDGFTGAHISSYDGVTFKNNEFEAIFAGDDNNDINYGASLKLMYCKNVKFIQNNFRGDHATLMWIQEVQNMLVMNNVFWNTNKFLATSGTHVPAAMRLVTQWNDMNNVAFYYNTYYFALNDKVSDSKYNFLHFSHTVSGGAGNFNLQNCYFKYNNCYSYDTDCPGSEDISLGDDAGNFCPNNFWSEYDQAIYDNLTDDKKATYTSEFAFGCSDNTFTNVKTQVCSTTATGPSSLIIKGTLMNDGVKPNVSSTGISLNPEEQYADRYIINARPNNGQSKDAGDPIEEIYWIGLSSDWDDRNNWEYITLEDPTNPESKRIRRRLSCVEELSDNLTAIVEDIASIEVAGGRKWPEIPDNFTSGRSNYDAREHVSAGLSSSKLGSTFANTIKVEYGAGIRGVEKLNKNNGTQLYYQKAQFDLVAPRSKWILVGSVVKPFVDEATGEVRNIKSGDYFRNYMPQVYIHKASLEDGNFSWGNTFSDLETYIEPQTVFAINIPDEYGEYKLPAYYYHKYFGEEVNPEEQITYDQFIGRFADDQEMRTYTGLEPGVPVLLNNTYPCNIDARVLEKVTGGSVQFYNYDAGGIASIESTTNAVLLRPQHGFVFTPAKGNTLTITKEMLVDGDTKSRSVTTQFPTLSMNLYNANTPSNYSNVVLRYDELQPYGVANPSDAPKVFTANVNTPEIYVMANDNKYSRFTASSQMQTIPLGIRLKKDMNVKFEKVYFTDVNNVYLVDTYNNKKIDLLRHSYTTEALIAGDIEGRFYINIEPKEENQFTPDDEDDVTTDVSESPEALSSISIYVDEADGKLIKVLGNNVELQTIYVSDMSGRTMKYEASGSYTTLKLPVMQGVYLVQVIGDKLTRNEKVIIK